MGDYAMGDYIAQMATAQAVDVYGWCGLCHAFTEFPHDCPGRDHQVDEEAAQFIG